MIDSLPLDMFGDDEPESPPAEETTATVACPWCAASVAADAEFCTDCGARIPDATPPPSISPDGICQWCGAPIAPDVDACPECGWDARGDSEIEMPGITTPLTENQIRSVYGGDDPADDLEGEADAIALATEVIRLFLPRG